MMKKLTAIFATLALIASCAFGAETAAAGGVKTVRFGSYPQSSAKAEPIEWLVLEETADSYFLLSRDALASLPWNTVRKATTWENASLRAWLNGEFFNAAFTKDERTQIVEAENANADDLDYGTAAGKNTRDKVFLLSGGEVKRLLPENLRTAKATA